MENVYILDKGTNITYYIKGVKSISPSFESTLTEYPIPEGGYIADHLYNNPNSLSMQVISDGFNSIQKSYSVDLNGNVTYLTYNVFKELLDSWSKNGTLLDVQTVHKLFTNVILTSVNWSESDRSWTMYSPKLEFKEARIAKLYSTTLNAIDPSHGADYIIEVGNSDGDDNGVETDAVTSEEVVGGVAGGALIGAGIGGVIGSIIPGVGNAIGAGIGGAIGAVIGFFDSLFG